MPLNMNEESKQRKSVLMKKSKLNETVHIFIENK